MDTDNETVQDSASSATGLASTAIVVLGMHRSGTSLIASLLHNALGVKMGERFWGNDPYHKHPNLEDLDFVQLNAQLLRSAGGQGNIAWREPPTRAAILALGESVVIQERIRSLVERKQHGLWGFKDPRSCLTAPLYHEHLVSPHYIVVVRRHEDIIKSLKKRDPVRQGDKYWLQLIRRYEVDRKLFLKGTKASFCVVQYEALVNRDKWQGAVRKMAQFIGTTPDMWRAKRIIAFRR